MPSLKLLTKYIALIVLVATVFGPFGVLEQAHAQSVPMLTGAEAGVPNSAPTPNKQGGVDPAYNAPCSGLTGCMASLVFYIGPGFASWAAGIVAYFFDFIVRISLNSTAYALGFLTTSWSLALNLANMAFIFILLGIAYTIMLKAETARTMQMLAWVIAIALVVNFSFFATRVVIDAGNILATQFYNAILTQPGVTPGTASTPPDITAPLMNALGVENLIGPGAFADAQKMFPTGSGFGTLLVLTVIFIATAIMLWMVAISLLMVGIKFFVRVVGLWLVLIISPVAFVTRVSPRTQHVFDMWLKTLVGFSFYPAVFLFMFYILNLFVKDVAGGNLLQSAFGQGNGAQGAATGTAGASASIIANIANVSIRMGFIIVMLYIMLKVADWVMEQSGGLAMTVMNRGSGLLVGGTARLGAFAGRNTVGRAAYRAAENTTLKNNTGLIGNALWRGASALSRSNFDIRNTPGLKRGASLLANVNVGKTSERSFSASVDARAKEVEKRAEALKATPVEVRNLQEAVNRQKAGRITELNKELEQARTAGDTQKEAKAMADLKAINNEGKTQAKAFEKERITKLAQRIGGRNLGNVGMPSMGSIKGAAAAMAIAEGKKKEKESASTSATTSTPNSTPPSAPAAVIGTPTSHGDDKVVAELKLIRKTIDKMRKQAAESTAHTTEALHSSADATAKIGLSIKHGLDTMKESLKASNDNEPPPHGTTPPPAANDNNKTPPPHDNLASADGEEKRAA